MRREGEAGRIQDVVPGGGGGVPTCPHLLTPPPPLQQ